MNTFLSTLCIAGAMITGISVSAKTNSATVYVEQLGKETSASSLKKIDNDPIGPLMQHIFYLPNCGVTVAVESFTALEGLMQALKLDEQCRREREIMFPFV